MWWDDLFNTLGVNYKTIRSLYIGSHFDAPSEEIPSAATAPNASNHSQLMSICLSMQHML